MDGSRAPSNSTMTLTDGRVVSVAVSGRLDVDDPDGHYTIWLPTVGEVSRGDIAPVVLD
ncbi:hypothetical protein [Saccharothrix stipae]